MEEGAGRKVGSCFFAAGRRLATDFYGGGTLRPPPYFSLIFAATPAHPPRRHAGSARPLATAGAEPPKKAAADGPLADPDGRPRSPRRLPFDPCHQDLHDISLFPCGQLPTGRDRMPLSQTTAAAAGCGMLSDENGVPPHGRLPAVVGNKRRREPPTHEIFGMTADDRHSPAFRYRRPLRTPDGTGCGNRTAPTARKAPRTEMPASDTPYGFWSISFHSTGQR